ncbi:hypothetical protein [Vulcanisaeta souniana]|uniref:Uncharacterized protein n=1 Tax=Vulcanisaeta souniana JCM 11219 TaxID=1293586 RepID=A0A830EJG6_9CREN|nr:hypothetical protein [Vulcanisaeta souniana]BDR93483.1 hypothetical protein Vsou_25760 [Vulcanisaeta souniana JCM 11219]GGI77483.1 hypothetical protein GCM10007112_12870 [Vulcanisaeta souniana JCM 11219]
MIPGIDIDITHLMILKFILHTIRETTRDGGPNPLWLSLAGHVSKATFYRKISELEMMGLLKRISRSRYLVSLGGYLLLLFAYFMNIDGINEDTAQAVIGAIKGNWGLIGFSDDEVESYVKLLYLSGRERLSNGLIMLYQEFPKNVLFILPNNLRLAAFNSLYEALINMYGDANTVSRARRVIAKALVDYFPTTDINGCKSVAFMDNGNKARILAMQCGNDYILN